MKSIVFPLLVGAILCFVAIERTDFSLATISAPLFSEKQEECPEEMGKALQLPYHFLGKGKQSFAFVSEDGKTVLKFFNRKYFEKPWYASLFSSETEKRERRKQFYLHSYSLAQQFLPKETGLLYLHQGQTERLPTILVKDRASRLISIDLNRVPFVLQKKGAPLFSALEGAQIKEGEERAFQILCAFVDLIAHRIALGLGDWDHEVEGNFGYLDGEVIHLDPGRLFKANFSDKERLTHEWWAATHSMRKWLQKNAPTLVSRFDEQVHQKGN